jgi:rubrerythrin
MGAEEEHAGSALRAFRTAFGLEAALAWIYRAAADVTSDSEAEEVLTSLAQAEEAHARRLMRAYPGLAERLGDDAELDGWSESRVRAAFIPELNVTSPADLLVAAYRIEVGGLEFYRRWAEEAEEQAIRVLATDLAQQEVTHAQRLERLYGDTVGGFIGALEEATRPLKWPELSE